MNIYQMYVENGKRPGFWIGRTTWGNTIARVISVGPLKGPAPYFGNPEVVARVYDIHTGAVKDERFVITTAGTYKTWFRAEAPEWAWDFPDLDQGQEA